MRSHYEIRSSLDALAARLAAARVADSDLSAKDVKVAGQAIIAKGRKAIENKKVKEMIRQDIAFHSYVYAISGNELIATSAELHWRFLRRVMGDVLRHAQRPPSIWDQHDAILNAIAAGNEELAERLAAEHIQQACSRLTKALEMT